MEQLATRDLRKLVGASGSTAAPCVSLYLPVADAAEDTEQRRRRLTRLLNKARETLLLHYPGVAVSMGRSLMSLVDKLPRFVPGRAVAIFVSEKVSGYIPLGERVNELAVVSETFHVKPLLSLMQGHERYFVLTLSATKAQVFEGNSRGLESREIMHRPLPKGDGSREILRFCQEIDRRLRSRFRGRHEPLMVVAPENLRSVYRRISRLRNQVDDPKFTTETAVLEPAALHALTWPTAANLMGRQKKRMDREFHMARQKRATLESFEDVARAAAEGRITSLFIEKDVQMWGRLDPQNLRVAKREGRGNEAVDCVLDDLAERVLAAGGNVYLLASGEMPTRSPIAAIVKRGGKAKPSV